MKIFDNYATLCVHMNKNDIVSFASEVLKAESDAILATANFILNDNLAESIKIILNTSGKVIMTGIGKSGIVAKKAAATLSSTGTPSFFLHPSEASHGDLGAIAKGDTIIALSVSGNTKELTDIIFYSKNNNINLIGITCNKDSILGQNSVINIILPKLIEADENQIAPSSTSTAMLALCDAIAFTLAKVKNFSKKDFLNFHPGGNLGKQLKSEFEKI